MEDKKTITINLTGLFPNNTGIQESEFYPQNPQNPQYSTITDKINEMISSDNSKINNIYSFMEDNRAFPYPDIGEIPVLKIKDEDTLKSGAKIQFFKNKNDDKFNKCKICGINGNAFFCEYCQKNICDNCSTNCKNDKDNNHKLINLKDYFKQALEPKKKFLHDFYSKYLDNSEVFPLGLDIILIKAIIEKDYNNYFHYQNINECYEYLKLYEDIYKGDCLKIKYAINKEITIDKNYKIFGKAFVQNNRDKIILTINGKKSPLVEKVEINNNTELLEVILFQRSKDDKKNLIEDMSYMFCDCKSRSIDIDEANQKKTLLDFTQVKDISNMFKDCTYLTKVNLFFLYNSKKIEKMSNLFFCCEYLTEIKHIDSLYTKLVKNMDRIFFNCKNLKELKDMEGFITKENGVESYFEMFKGCSSLQALPNMKDWNKGKAKIFEGMFKGCSELKEFPGINHWNMGEVKSLKGMFKGCSALVNIPNISGWDVRNVVDMTEMFSGCMKLANINDLKEWKLNNIIYMDETFFGCFNLILNNVKIEDVFNIDNFEKISRVNVLGFNNPNSNN